MVKIRKYRVVDYRKWDRAKCTVLVVLVVVTYMMMLYDNGTHDKIGVSSWALVPLIPAGLLAWNLFIKEGKKK